MSHGYRLTQNLKFCLQYKRSSYFPPYSGKISLKSLFSSIVKIPEDIFADLKNNLTYDVVKLIAIWLAVKLVRFIGTFAFDVWYKIRLSYALLIAASRRKANYFVDHTKLFIVFIAGIAIFIVGAISYKLILERTDVQPIVVFRTILLGAIFIILVKQIINALNQKTVDAYLHEDGKVTKIARA